MKNQDFSITISTNITTRDAFKRITSVSKWWTENLEGRSQKLNDEFTVRFGDIHYSKQRLIEVIPEKKIVWLVTDSNLSWLKDKHEWTNTKISFEITNKDNLTQIEFTHIGLVPGIECFIECSNAWSQYIHQSLFSLITTGKGQPDPGEPKIRATKKNDVINS